jgi:polyisoprenoid-binding protein YceI
MKAILILSLVLLPFTWLAAQNLKPIDKGSKVHFVIRNFGINTGGDFGGLDGNIQYDPADPTKAVFDVSVEAKSINTDMESRDNHLKKAEFFDVATYPKVKFKSTKVSHTNNPKYLYMYGDLTIKGVSKSVKFPFSVTPHEGGYLFEGDFQINRRDFGVGGNSLSMSNDVNIILSVFAK